MSDERIYFEAEKESVKITSARVIVGQKTYAMSGITSVGFVVQKPKRLLPFALLIGGLLLAKSNPEASIWHWLSLAAPGALWLIVQKTAYALQINSASGEQKAMTGNDGGFVRKVVAAINQAIVERG